MDSHTLIIGFDPSHAPRISRTWHAAGSDKPLVLTLDVELEWLLTKEGIPFHSANDFRNRESADHIVRAEAWVTAIMASPSWRSLVYKEVPLLPVFAFTLEFYLMQCAYYAPLMARAITAFPTIHTLLVCGSALDLDPHTPMRTRDPNAAIVRCVNLLATRLNSKTSILEDLSQEIRRKRLSRMRFKFVRSAFGVCIEGYNLLIALVPRKKIRILASENWHNIAPLFKELPEAELTLLDRAQIQHMPLSTLINHRIRLKHLDAYDTHITDSVVHAEAAALNQTWREYADTLRPFVIDGTDLSALAHEALEVLFASRMVDALICIEETRAMLLVEKPHLVLVRASVSSQIHFPILSLVARSLGIPSVELQHGLEYLGPGSISREHTAEYIATYGKLVQEELHRIGYSYEKIPVIGSPRFDTYSTVTKHHSALQKMPSVLVIAPDTITPSFTSYEIVEYYRDIAKAVSEVEVIIKLRPGPDREMFHRRAIAEAFAHTSYRIMQYESVADLLAEVQVVVTCYSTVVLEALMHQVPVVLAGLTPNEALMMREHFGPYANQGILTIAHTSEEIAAAIRAPETKPGATEVFLKSQFAFDGNSSKRMRELVLKLAGPESAQIEDL